MKSYIKDEAKIKLKFSKIKSFHNEINRKTTGKRYKNFKKPLSRFFFAQVYTNQKPNTRPKDGKSLVKMKINYISL